ncbi:MAG: hypothetical protein K1W22_12240 [Lachnospiraceae bacterium]
MIDKSSEIFTHIMYAVQPLCSSASQTYQDSPSKFPHIFVDNKDNPVTDTDMENSECAVTPMVEITTYTKDGLSSAKKIISLADTEMRNMGFKRSFGPQQVTNVADTSITRVIARYSRRVADGDEL